MAIKALTLKNVRCLKDETFVFGKDNWVTGPNASGKTTLLEALVYFVRAGSFRTKRLQDLIARGSEEATIELFFDKCGVDQVLRLHLTPEKKSVVHNQTIYTSALQVMGIIQGVMVSADDGEILMGPPPVRRRLLDLLLAQADPLYVHHLLRYGRALKHRNACLKQQLRGPLDAFEAHMAVSATYLWNARDQLLKSLSQSTQRRFQKLFPAELSMTWNAGDPEFVEQLKKGREADFRLGYTRRGPHRDDIGFTIDGMEAKQFASEGQRRLAVFALKFAQWDWLNEMCVEKPFFAIDEWGQGLDQQHKGLLKEQLQELGQVFATVPGESLALTMSHSVDA